MKIGHDQILEQPYLDPIVQMPILLVTGNTIGFKTYSYRSKIYNT